MFENLTANHDLVHYSAASKWFDDSVSRDGYGRPITPQHFSSPSSTSSPPSSPSPSLEIIEIQDSPNADSPIIVSSSSSAVSESPAYASISKLFELEAEGSSDTDDDSDVSVDLDDKISDPDSDGEQWTRRVRRKITFGDN